MQNPFRPCSICNRTLALGMVESRDPHARIVGQIGTIKAYVKSSDGSLQVWSSATCIRHDL